MSFSEEEQTRKNAKVQEEFNLIEYKRSAKATALNTALTLRSYETYGSKSVSEYAPSSKPTPDKKIDIIQKADAIYKWMLEI